MNAFLFVHNSNPPNPNTMNLNRTHNSLIATNPSNSKTSCPAVLSVGGEQRVRDSRQLGHPQVLDSVVRGRLCGGGRVVRRCGQQLHAERAARHAAESLWFVLPVRSSQQDCLRTSGQMQCNDIHTPSYISQSPNQFPEHYFDFVYAILNAQWSISTTRQRWCPST